MKALKVAKGGMIESQRDKNAEIKVLPVSCARENDLPKRKQNREGEKKKHWKSVQGKNKGEGKRWRDEIAMLE